jgi:hypothetical protein
MREEFKEVSDDDSLNTGNANYTPYVNVMERAQKLAKDAGLSVESVNFSPDGKWIIKNKNGEQLMQPLSKLFEASLGSDPAIQSVYKTQAYVNRKDYAYGNASMFGGNKDAAEARYLENQFNILKQENIQRYNALKDESNAYNKNIQDLESQIKSGKAHPQAERLLSQLKSNKEINDAILNRIDSEAKEFSGQNNTPSTQGNSNPYGDIKTLRAKVDNAVASKLMQKDLNEAAQVFAYKDAKMDVEANPYAVNEQKHSHALSQIAARNKGMQQNILLKAELEKKNNDRKAKLDSGAYYINPDTDELEMLESFKPHAVTDPSGTSTDQISAIQLSRDLSRNMQQNYVDPAISTMLKQMEGLIQGGKMTKEDAKAILGRNFDDFRNKFNSDSYKFVRGDIKGENLEKIVNGYQKFLQDRKEDHSFGTLLSEFGKQSLAINDYTQYLKADTEWRKETSQIVEQQLYNKGYKFVKYLYDKKGNLRSEDAFYEEVLKNDPSMSAELELYNQTKQREKEIELLGKKTKIEAQAVGLPEFVANAAAWFTKTLERGPDWWVKDLIKENKLAPISYKDIVNAANKVWSNSNIIKTPPPALSGGGTGTGVFGKSTAVQVNPKAVGTHGYIFFNQTLSDIDNMDIDMANSYFSFGGVSQSNLPNKDNASDIKNISQAILGQLRQSVVSGKTTNFFIEAHPVALNNAKKGAMTIRIDQEWINKNTSSKAGDGKLLTADQSKLLSANGLTIIADRTQFNNGLFKGSSMTPLEASVMAAGDQGITITDPVNPNNQLKIVKSQTSGGGDFIITPQYGVPQPDGSVALIPTAPIYHDRFSGTLEDLRNSFLNDATFFNKSYNIIP